VTVKLNFGSRMERLAKSTNYITYACSPHTRFADIRAPCPRAKMKFAHNNKDRYSRTNKIAWPTFGN